MLTIRRPMFLLAVIALVVAGAALPLRADDLNPPDYRGAVRSTSAEWDFLTDQDMDAILPDGTSVPLVVGDTAGALDAAFPDGAPHPSCSLIGDVVWSSNSNGGYRGGPGEPGVLVCNIPNWLDLEPEKRLRVQLTYTGPAPDVVVFGFLGVPGSSDDVEEVFLDRVQDTALSLPAGSSYFFEDWKMFPNPDWEQVAVFLHDGTFLDQLVIDTVSAQYTADGVVVLFADGLETGNTSRWSSTTPP